MRIVYTLSMRLNTRNGRTACWLYNVQFLLTNNARSKMRTTFVIPNSNDAIWWMESSLCFGVSIPWHILTSKPSWQTYLRVQQRSHLLWMNDCCLGCFYNVNAKAKWKSETIESEVGFLRFLPTKILEKKKKTWKIGICRTLNRPGIGL